MLLRTFSTEFTSCLNHNNLRDLTYKLNCQCYLQNKFKKNPFCCEFLDALGMAFPSPSCTPGGSREEYCIMNIKQVCTITNNDAENRREGNIYLYVSLCFSLVFSCLYYAHKYALYIKVLYIYMSK